ncbi:serine acetyltransferase [Duncaniella muris]|uniref:serine acetyltransferase n=1 Tax=Duncaniella muris TaxID=2094150 RepID=UPI002675A1DC|nr:serine acetyltransferase [Duncaniella muris]
MEKDPDKRFEIDEVIGRLCSMEDMRHVCPTRSGEGEPLLSNSAVRRIVELASRLMFPGFLTDSDRGPSVMRSVMTIECHELRGLLASQISAGLCFDKNQSANPDADISRHAGSLADSFIDSLPDLRHILDTDIDATYLGDPAATSTHEVIICYPGFKATVSYRIAHRLLELGVPVVPRMITEQAHSDTGIDIHPGARIGKGFVIDHGTGVVIGATAIIGDNVKIYQGVTLGAKSFVTDDSNNPVKGIPRHPILGNGVVVYSNSTILGRVNIGDGAVIGGNLWVTRDVEPGEKLIQARADNFRSAR